MSTYNGREMIADVAHAHGWAITKYPIDPVSGQQTVDYSDGPKHGVTYTLRIVWTRENTAVYVATSHDDGVTVAREERRDRLSLIMARQFIESNS